MGCRVAGVYAGIAVGSGHAQPQFVGIVDGGGVGKSCGNAAVLCRRSAIYNRGGQAGLADTAARRSGVICGLLLSAQRDPGLRKRALGNGAARERSISLGGDGVVEVAAIAAWARSALARGRVLVDGHPRIGSSAVAATSLFLVASGLRPFAGRGAG